jgi:hypothetical protein
MSHQYRLGIFSLLLLIVFFQTGCGSLEMESEWREQEIVVDGKSDDWVGILPYFEEKNISAGVQNDDNFFYMCMIIDEPPLRNQIMTQGLRLWFDPEGGDEKAFGIKYPLGLSMLRPDREFTDKEREKMRETGRPQAPDRAPDQERRQQIFERTLGELEILSAGIDEGIRMAVEEAKGIEIRLKMYNAQVVYECKIPLLASEGMPYVIKAHSGDAIGVGLESPQPDLQGMRGRTGGGMPSAGGRGGGVPGGGSMTGSGRGGMGGGMAGMPGGRGGRGGNRQLPEEVKVWASVQLATK